ncbi:MAG: D-alanine--D-alanine ligase [Oscillospiraceae bacterium]|nr:D-alanine--D-alanine ligase [Oscillospiraceae bacterium]
MSKKKIAVLFGGISSEYEISLKSASFVIKNIDEKKYEVICIGINKKGNWIFYPGDIENIADGSWEKHPDCTQAFISPDRLKKGIVKILSDGTISKQSIDLIFPVLHGKYGEDGTVQGLFDLSGIPYVGCNLISSAVCMDKIFTHTILDYNKIKTSRWRYIKSENLDNLDKILEDIIDDLGIPLFIKPANSGSSIGVSKASNYTELKKGVKLAFLHDRKILIEEFIDGREVEIAIMGNEEPIISRVGEIESANEFYDFDSKYILKQSFVKIPTDLPKNIEEYIKNIAKKAYEILDCRGLSRIDFFVDKKENIILNEINTMPGFTEISMYPKLFEDMGMTSKEIIQNLIDYAFIERSEIDG